MPKISQFHGVSIYMYFMDHAPPHFHAMHGDNEALIAIVPPTLLQGSLPRKALKNVLEWATLNQAALVANWQLAQAGQPLHQVPPLP
jgi:hypothetical protein